jgi:hypothetical protein
LYLLAGGADEVTPPEQLLVLANCAMLSVSPRGDAGSEVATPDPARPSDRELLSLRGSC